MSLILKILSFNGQPYAGDKEIVIDEQGGTIGRADTNALVLNDENKTISRRHAVLEFENGQYKLIDSSLGGTFIDDAVEPIHNSSVQLVDGMQIRIGDYIIACNITAVTSPLLSDNPGSPFADDNVNHPLEENKLSEASKNDLNSPFADAARQNFSADLLSSAENHSTAGLLNDLENNDLLNCSEPDFNNTPELERNNLLDASPNPESQPSQSLMAENSSFLNDSFEPARPIEDNSILDNKEIPENFNFEDLFKLEENESGASITEQGQDIVPPVAEKNQSALLSQDTPEPLPSEPILTESSLSEPLAAEKKAEASEQVSGVDLINAGGTSQLPLSNNDDLIPAFLHGLQMGPENIDFSNPVDKMTRIGKMFRQFVESTVAVLRSRAEFKSLFRVNVTTIQRVDNNPLKFAITTDDAVKHLINDGEAGFKESVESIDEGFNDLLNHQLAMQAGIQASLNDILKQFDPALIERQYAEGLVLQKKSKCWDKYNQIHKRLTETAVEDFYGDAFSEAYNKQMEQLKK